MPSEGEPGPAVNTHVPAVLHPGALRLWARVCLPRAFQSRETAHVPVDRKIRVSGWQLIYLYVHVARARAARKAEDEGGG